MWRPPREADIRRRRQRGGGAHVEAAPEETDDIVREHYFQLPHLVIIFGAISILSPLSAIGAPALGAQPGFLPFFVECSGCVISVYLTRK